METKNFYTVEEWELRDDESTRKKLEVMGKWDAMTDDGRNRDNLLESVDEFLKLGKRYRIILTITEIGDCE